MLHKTKTGELMLIQDMSNNHLINTIYLVRDKIKEQQDINVKLIKLINFLAQYVLEANLRNIDITRILQDEVFQTKIRTIKKTESLIESLIDNQDDQFDDNDKHDYSLCAYEFQVSSVAD